MGHAQLLVEELEAKLLQMHANGSASDCHMPLCHTPSMMPWLHTLLAVKLGNQSPSELLRSVLALLSLNARLRVCITKCSYNFLTFKTACVSVGISVEALGLCSQAACHQGCSAHWGPDHQAQPAHAAGQHLQCMEAAGRYLPPGGSPLPSLSGGHSALGLGPVESPACHPGAAISRPTPPSHLGPVQ